MYVPVYWAASQTQWRSDEMGHGPIILMIVLWLFWRARKRIVLQASAPMHTLGWPLFAIGVLLYVFGRVFSVASVEFISQIFVVSSGLVLLGGRGGLQAAWFPLLYLLFLVPLPASLIDAITGSLKGWVSALVVDFLYALGYPIARTGVMISIGPYQLLVADACSGLNSMFSLTAVGALFIYFQRRAHRLHNVIMIASILPIAFMANVLRVMILSLITYHFGDEAGAGFLHGAAGLVLMAAAVTLLLLLDAALAATLGRQAKARHPRPAEHERG